MEKGKVSCIISTYNTKKEYLIEAVESVLNQTYKNLELIVIDDGSKIPVKDSLKEIIDERLIIIRNETNKGLPYSRNRGLEIISGEYMAVMDSDDVIDSKKFEKQIAFFKKNPIYDLVSTQMAFLSNDNRVNPFLSIPKNTKEYQVKLFWDNSKPFPHGPSMIKTDFLLKNNIKYYEKYIKSLDYRLWVDCARYGARFKILDEYLYFYRVHDGQISQSKRDEQQYYANQICLDQLEYLNINPTDEEKKIHLALKDFDCYSNVNDTFIWVNKIIDANNKILFYDKYYFDTELKYHFYKMCYKEYIEKHNNDFKKMFFKSLSLYNIVRSIKAVYDNKVDKKHPKVLKV